MTTGTKKATLKYFLQCAALLMASASTRAPMHWQGTMMMTNLTVFKND
jgi:hypothetical protein